MRSIYQNVLITNTYKYNYKYPFNLLTDKFSCKDSLNNNKYHFESNLFTYFKKKNL